jgi:hypothetical protein
MIARRGFGSALADRAGKEKVVFGHKGPSRTQSFQPMLHPPAEDWDRASA